MITAEHIEFRIKVLVLEHLGLPSNTQLEAKTNLIDDLDADSLDLIEMCMALEDEFNIEIPDSEMEKHETIQSFVDLVRPYLKNKDLM